MILIQSISCLVSNQEEKKKKTGKEQMSSHGSQKSYFSSLQSPSHVWLFATPWTEARQSFVSITNSCSPPKPMSIESVIPSNHLILCHSLLLLPNLSWHESLFKWVSSSHQVAKVLEFQLQHQSFQWTPRIWSPLRWTGWISLQSKGLSRVFSNTTV